MRSLRLSLSACTLVDEYLSIYLSEGSSGHQEYSQFFHRSNFASSGEKFNDIFASYVSFVGSCLIPSTFYLSMGRKPASEYLGSR
jgi:hypothetical protein